MLTLAVLLFHTSWARPLLDGCDRAGHIRQPQKAHEATKKSHAVREARPHRSAAPGKNRHAKHASAQRKAKPSKASPAPKEAIAPLTGDLALVKEAIDLARKAKTEEATAIRNRIADPAAQKLVEWFILRRPETTATFGRYAAFIALTAGRARPFCAGAQRRAVGAAQRCATVRGFTGDRPHYAKASCAGERARQRATGTARPGWRAIMAGGRIVGAPGDRVLETPPRHFNRG